MINIEDHLGLVTNIVNKFFHYSNEKEDLIQTGYLGLIKAAKSFDENRKLTFSTFAYKCILNEITTYVYQESFHYLDEIFYNTNYNFDEFLPLLDIEELQILDLLRSNYSMIEISNILKLKYNEVTYIKRKIKDKIKLANENIIM